MPGCEGGGEKVDIACVDYVAYLVVVTEHGGGVVVVLLPYMMRRVEIHILTSRRNKCKVRKCVFFT